ncbi:uncharacterized protein LOC119675274 [Teleopsis dalmanni]|uniref:uncharacterized protein LOC119675274 n=1 Tax=Teleopsis dalmanni TaxID=139649 RepID=UPI0018CE181C|nr:uncharacterized protein LOC119675274 [Teleopsis dalmanni]
MTPLIRFNTVKRLNLCLNCLSEGHTVSKCSSKNRCKICKKSHHTLLHKANENSEDAEATAPTSKQTVVTSPPKEVPPAIREFVSTSNINAHMSSDTEFLATAVVLIRDGTGQWKICRALLDSCSQVNLVTESLAKILNLSRQRKVTNIVGTGGSSSKIKFETSTIVRSRYNDEEFAVNLLITNRVSGYQPEIDIDVSNWNIPSSINLADENFQQTQGIDVLLGAENFFEILKPHQLKLGLYLPKLQDTSFGRVVSGRYKTTSCIQNFQNRSFVIQFDNTSDEDLNLQLEDMKLTKPALSPEDRMCEQSFVSTIETLPDGRLQVKLPFKDNPSVLGQSYELALRRFLSLEKRLDRNPTVKALYT